MVEWRDIPPLSGGDQRITPWARNTSDFNTGIWHSNGYPARRLVNSASTEWHSVNAVSLCDWVWPQLWAATHNSYLSVAACKIVLANPSLKCAFHAARLFSSQKPNEQFANIKDHKGIKSVPQRQIVILHNCQFCTSCHSRDTEKTGYFQYRVFDRNRYQCQKSACYEQILQTFKKAIHNNKALKGTTI